MLFGVFQSLYRNIEFHRPVWEVANVKSFTNVPWTDYLSSWIRWIIDSFARSELNFFSRCRFQLWRVNYIIVSQQCFTVTLRFLIFFFSPSDRLLDTEWVDKYPSLIQKHLIIKPEDSWKVLSSHLNKGRSHNTLDKEFGFERKQPRGELWKRLVECAQLLRWSCNTSVVYCWVHSNRCDILKQSFRNVVKSARAAS